MIGLTVAAEADEAYKKMKMKRAYRWIIYRVDGEKDIVVDTLGEPKATFADFAAKMPKDQPRYATYDMEVTHSDGRKESKLLMFLYAPDTCDTKSKFIYACGKDSLKKKIGTVNKEFQVLFIGLVNNRSETKNIDKQTS